MIEVAYSLNNGLLGILSAWIQEPKIDSRWKVSGMTTRMDLFYTTF